MKEPVQRRLAAILAADVAGYSRLMGADEEGTLDRLKAHRRELVDPKVKEHRGRIVKLTGDGALVEFPSVVDAVKCAFENLSRDPDQEYFADGITDDLTTDLSRISGSFVIARNTAFTFKGKAADVKQIGRELGVHYVIEGSVRRRGDQVQVNVQLIDAETAEHVWADRFDTNRTNLAEAQGEITGRL